MSQNRVLRISTSDPSLELDIPRVADLLPRRLLLQPHGKIKWLGDVLTLSMRESVHLSGTTPVDLHDLLRKPFFFLLYFYTIISSVR